MPPQFRSDNCTRNFAGCGALEAFKNVIEFRLHPTRYESASPGMARRHPWDFRTGWLPSLALTPPLHAIFGAPLNLVGVFERICVGYRCMYILKCMFVCVSRGVHAHIYGNSFASNQAAVSSASEFVSPVQILNLR